ncbi:MAG: filamentous hemagglutinin N-terminal domain-containing protein [Pseudomonas sp.]|uniref:two-partner secretion domain-containing protein n=1 Tax=Pseudomonas sp. TaxID=306 RepID=UPI0030F03690
MILGNSQLGGRAAGLILNEVTGGSPSQLKGYTEVAGQSAHVVVANPHGITCDGCGFINTPRVTLSTGAPIIEAGQLRQFNVDGGQIVIDGAGLNAANISQFDLITRSAKLNAAIYAQQLNIVTGRNDVDAATLAATAKADDGRARPGVSIDSSALGGMYAGAIRLVGTEAGVGVKLAGDMAASGDDIHIDAYGKLTVARVVSAGQLRAKAEQIEFADKAHADGAVKIAASSAVTVAKSLTSAADVSIKAGSLSNGGTLGAAGSVRLDVAALLNQSGLIFSGEDMALNVASIINQTGDVYSLGNLTITATDGIDNRSGSIESAGDLKLQAKRISNQRDVLNSRQEKYAAQITELPCDGTLGAGDCEGGKEHQFWQIVERDRLLVTTASAASFITAGGNLSLMGASLLNHASAISAAGDLRIQVDTLDNLGLQPGEYQTSRVFRSVRTRDPEFLERRAEAFSARYWPSSDDPLGLVNALNGFLARMERERLPFRTTAVVKADGESYSAVIQAAGKAVIATQDRFDSSVVRPTYAYVAGGSLATTDLTGSAIATAVSHNPQLAPDLNQQPGLPGFTLPAGSNGLFQLNSDGSHPYLVETNPALASLRGFLSSDYLLKSIGYNLDHGQRRLGDGLYEQRLVQQAVIARTGKRFLDGLSSDHAQFRYLMDNAIASKQALNLVPGIALSAEQVAALTHDIVWMQEQEVTGQKLLVPVLYLAHAKDRLAPTGALIQGDDLTLISGNALNNSGTLRSTKKLNVSAANISNSGLIQADQNVLLLATDSIRNIKGGLIVGKDVSASALTRDIVNERSVTSHQSSKQGFQRREDFVDSAAGIEAANTLTLSAGRDLINRSGNLSAGSNLQLSAGRDLSITSQVEADSAANRERTGHSWRETITQHGSSIDAGGTLIAEAGRDLAIIASTLKATGDIQLSAQQNFAIASAADHRSRDSYRKSAGKKVTDQASISRQQSAVIEAGGELNIQAGNNLLVSASQLKAGDEAFLYAGNQLALLSAENSDHRLYDSKKKGSWGAKHTRKDRITSVRNIGATIETGGDLKLISEGDQLYQKAVLHSGANLTLDSGGAITFEAVKDLEQESHERSKSDWAWHSAKGQGRADEILRQSELIAGGETIIRALQGLRIDVKQVNRQTVRQTIDAMVAADPNLAWIKAAQERGDVDWRQVKELHDAWEYQSSGLGVGAALVIAIVVTVLTAGAASTAIGTVAGATAGSGTAMAAGLGTTAAGFGNVAATAAATSMASSAAVSTINNKGQLGAVARDVFSSDSLKGYLSAALIAGVGAQTKGWGTTMQQEANLSVVDWGERAKAYAVNTALKGLLSGDDTAKSWLTVAGTGAMMELYQYSVGRGADIRPGVERSAGAKFTPLEGGFVPQVVRDGLAREGKNIGMNWPAIEACSSWYAICHGTPISDAVNKLPGLNSFATLHDSWMVLLEMAKKSDMSTLENIGSMPPALIVNYGALYDKYQVELRRVRKNKSP